MSIRFKRLSVLVGVLSLAFAAVGASADVLPESRRYVLFHKKQLTDQGLLNHAKRKTYSVSVVAPRLVIEKEHENGVYERLNGRLGIKELLLGAEELVIRERLELPQTNVTIEVDRLIFEGEGAIVTTPVALKTAVKTPGANGAPGVKAGDVHVRVRESFEASDSKVRFVLVGGKGQTPGPGEKGLPGKSVPRREIKCRNNKCLDFTGFGLNFVFANVVNKFPTDGHDAKPAGVSGNGGVGGTFNGSPNISFEFVNVAGGEPGDAAKASPGGAGGNPRHAITVILGIVDTQPVSTSIMLKAQRKSKDGKANVPKRGRFGQMGKRKKGTLPSDTWKGASFAQVAQVALYYAEDLYFVGRDEQARKVFQKYLLRANDPDRVLLSDENEVRLSASVNRMALLSNQIDTNVDYYGNPLHWTPPLSLETYKILFEKESLWAIKSIYLSRLVRDKKQSVSARLKSLKTAQDVLLEENEFLEEEHNEGVALLPDIEQELNSITKKSDELIENLKQIEKELEEQAKDNLKTPWWRKALRVVATAAKSFPIGQPYLGAAGTVLDVASNFDADKPLDSIKGNEEALSKAFASLSKSSKDDKKSKDKEKVKDEAKKENSKEKKQSLFEKLKKSGPYLKSAFKTGLALAKELKDKAIPEDELKAEIKKLKESSSRFINISAQCEDLIAEKLAFRERVNKMNEAIAHALATIQDNYVKIAELSDAIALDTESQLTPGAELALVDMERAARKRLRKYHYYLQRAYEYRMLRAYEGDKELAFLFEELEKFLAIEGASASEATYNSLYTLYRNELSVILERSIKDVENTGKEQLSETFFSLNERELNELRTGVTLVNLVKRGSFLKGEENVRIRKIEVVEAELADGEPLLSRVDVTVTHSGLSKLYLNGTLHVFQHYDRRLKNSLNWATRIHDNGLIEPHKISPNQVSLFKVLLGSSVQEFEIYIRPSGWSDLKVALNFNGERAPHYKQLRFKVDYTYFRPDTFATWQHHFEAQKERIFAIYQQVFEREPLPHELETARGLLDIGYRDADLARVIRRFPEPMEAL